MSHWRTLQFHFSAMASPCLLQVDGRNERAMRSAAAKAIAEVHRIEQKYSRYTPNSVISRINQAAGETMVDIDPETVGLLDYADRLWALSDGLFDATSGVLRKAWDFKRAAKPGPGVLDRLLPLVGWQHVERKGSRVRLPMHGMELDVGGFGKEYAADRAALTLQQCGFEHALVNLGGDLNALGPRGLPECEGAPWTIEIQHPRPERPDAGTSLAHIPLERGGLATSGDYERFFIVDEQRYCHVLDPRTGWPVNSVQSVSVLAANTSAAGAMTTIAMLKQRDAIAWLNTQHVDYLLVDSDARIHTNTSLQTNASPATIQRTPS